MKKIVLKTVDLVKFNNFIDSLIPLNERSTIYFRIDSNGLTTDSYNESGTIIKSIQLGIDKLCGENNLEKLEKPVKLCFYDGKKVKKAFSYLSGNEITCEIKFSELESTGEFFADNLKISSPKISISLDGADPELFEFANVPEEDIERVKDISNTDCSFRITANEILQIKKLSDFDTNEEIEIKVGKEIKVCSDDSYDISISDEFDGIEDNLTYKIDKKLFNLIDSNSYTVYPSLDEFKIIFKSEDKKTDVVITLHEEPEL